MASASSSTMRTSALLLSSSVNGPSHAPSPPPDQLERHGIPVLDVRQLLRRHAGLCLALPRARHGLHDRLQPRALGEHHRQRRHRPPDRGRLLLAGGVRVVVGERLDGSQRGRPPQGQLRQVAEAADEVAVGVPEREGTGVGEDALVATEDVPVVAPVGEASEGQVVVV
uniref:Uncharacterized protein n=1 Tax=Oryza brachyantha TaxID=4533 RepID=J3LRP8_ORYBR